MTDTSDLATVFARVEHCPDDPFLESLIQEASVHRAVRHPWLDALAEGALPDLAGAVRDFAWQYQGYSAWFPRYLRTTIDRVPNPDHKALLEANLREEQGELDAAERDELRDLGIPPESVDGVPHPELFRRFCRALGITGTALAQPGPDALAWRSRFLAFLDRATAAEAVGALGLGTETIVKLIYSPILRALRQLPLTRSDYVFFELHCLVDDQHQLDLYAIAHSLARTDEGRAGIRHGMLQALDLRACFWDALYARATGMREVSCA